MLKAGCKCHAYGWGLCPNPHYLKNRSVYTGAVTETGQPWKTGNGVTSNERTCVTFPVSVSLSLEHHSVLSPAFPQRPGYLLLGGRGEDHYIWALCLSHFTTEVRNKGLSNPVLQDAVTILVIFFWAIWLPPWPTPVNWFLSPDSCSFLFSKLVNTFVFISKIRRA